MLELVVAFVLAVVMIGLSITALVVAAMKRKHPWEQ